MVVEVATLPPTRVIYIRHVGPYMECGKAWEEVYRWAGEHGLFSHAPRAFGLSHDDPTSVPAEKLRYDACLSVPADFRASGGMQAQLILGGEYARHRMRGPYSGLAPTFVRMLHEWMPSSGWTPRAGAFVEEYVTDPRTTPEPELITDLYVPVRRAV